MRARATASRSKASAPRTWRARSPEQASALGVRGHGEVTAISVAPNAAYHATCKRVRGLPITVEKISEGRDGPEARRRRWGHWPYRPWPVQHSPRHGDPTPDGVGRPGRFKTGETPDQATHRIEPGPARFGRVIAADSARWYPMLPRAK